MSADVTGEKLGTGSTPGGRKKLSGSRARPNNLQYVRPQYRAATPLPGEGEAVPVSQEEKEAQIRLLNEQQRAKREALANESSKSTPANAEVNTQKASKDDMFADYEEEDDSKNVAGETGEAGVSSPAADQGPAPQETVQPEGKKATPEVKSVNPKSPEQAKTKEAQQTKSGGCCVIQ
mmetsp:Transcript_10578/g.44101  ORF Transcript_10578/g.44101 Transcript_10578/m.44101 type:complete len:178 (-) Transcript_10578:888-1421(-)|eukprot:CAMPEP_0113966166 /NCGR_PEP_ID=MMETSP0011_2-20120614/8178_1 /TAXON_ID=101924 /ORGANISM="Rhodosorus marinus" /LENGTH=177 /DNA_ID=CAMNT_0000978817 /DNA_START=233 /DNA_END=766 /DNA_ORIENTATION=+ /assembly_acc=CAM_ASM_000156